MREAMGLSVRELAARIDPPVSYSYLAAVEREEREPTDRWLQSVRAALAAELARESA